MEFNLNGSFRVEKELICSNLLQISINGCFVLFVRRSVLKNFQMEKLQSYRVFHILKRLRIDELNNEHYKLGILSYTDIHCVEQKHGKHLTS